MKADTFPPAHGDNGSGQVVILGHYGDATATHVAVTLRRLDGRIPVLLLTAEELVLAPTWIHRQCSGVTQTVIRLADGTDVRLAEHDLVVNRLRAASLPQAEQFSPVDRTYAAMEWFALLLSWLESLRCRVVNRPSPLGLGAHARTEELWRIMAADSGLPVAPLVRSTDPRRRTPPPGIPLPSADQTRTRDKTLSSTLALGSLSHGPLAERHGSEIRAFQARTGLEISQFLCTQYHGQPAVTNVYPIPELSSQSDIDALARHLLGDHAGEERR